MSRLVRLAALASAIALAGCASLSRPPPTAATAPGVPAAAPRVTGGAATGGEHARIAAAFGGEWHAPALDAYLGGILAKLAPASAAPTTDFRITVLNSPSVNAFALPDGDLFVTRGLLALADDTSEVAAVLAHEMGHVSAHHAAKRANFARREALFTKVAAVLSPTGADPGAARSAQADVAEFSRAQELDADRIGIETLAKAGYDPAGAARFLENLLRDAAGGRAPDIMASHPTTPARIAAARALAAKLAGPDRGARGRAAYFAAIDGLPYGDDPAEGVVRGRLFVHPRLGFSFEAPPGFALQNTAPALIGVSADGAEAVRLDSVLLPASTDIAAYLNSGWIAGLDAGSIAPLGAGGPGGETATASATPWTFRIAAIPFRGQVYRIVFAAKSMTPATEAAFKASIASFHALRTGESALATGAHVAVVTAAAGDTAAALASRMAPGAGGLKAFEAINGLAAGEAPVSGASYKIVVR